MDNSVIVSLRDIVVEFDGQRILDGLNLDIHDKEFVTLLGSSGCGKTTTLRPVSYTHLRRTGLDQVMPRLIRSLSKGYRQRVGIAQALSLIHI